MPASRDMNRGRASTLGTLLAVTAAGVLLGGVSVAMLRSLSEVVSPGAAQAAAPAQKPAPGKPVAAPEVQVRKSGTSPAPVAASKSVAAKPGVVRPGPAKGPASAAPAAAKTSVVQPLTQLDDHITYQYNTLGRRDPFNPLLGGDFVGADMGGSAPVEVGGMTVVGIVWGAEDKFALVEDARGNSVILRQGDKVMNGHVEALKRDAVIVNLSMDGQEQSVAIPLTKKGDSNANR